MQFFPIRFIPENTSFDFMHIKKISYALSIFLSILCFICIGVNKFNYGIDFIGGISIEVRTNQIPNLPEMREVLSNLHMGEVTLQNFGSDRDISIRVGVSSEENLMQNIALIKKTLSDNFPYKFEYRKVDFVGPQIG